MADSHAVCQARYHAAHRDDEEYRARQRANWARYRVTHHEERRVAGADWRAAHPDYAIHYNASTAGILAQERAYQKRMRGGQQ